MRSSSCCPYPTAKVVINHNYPQSFATYLDVPHGLQALAVIDLEVSSSHLSSAEGALDALDAVLLVSARHAADNVQRAVCRIDAGIRLAQSSILMRLE